jgi:hypothetical protein
MAFDTAQTKIRAVGRAGNVLGLLRTVYTHADELTQALTTYQAGTDPALNAAFNALFTAAERIELAAMIIQLQTLKADWEANHTWVQS